MFRDFYTAAQELHEAIKQIRNVWIPLREEEVYKNISKPREDVFRVKTIFTHYMKLDNGETDYCCMSKGDNYPKALLYFEG